MYSQLWNAKRRRRKKHQHREWHRSCHSPRRYRLNQPSATFTNYRALAAQRNHYPRVRQTRKSESLAIALLLPSRFFPKVSNAEEKCPVETDRNFSRRVDRDRLSNSKSKIVRTKRGERFICLLINGKAARPCVPNINMPDAASRTPFPPSTRSAGEPSL